MHHDLNKWHVKFYAAPFVLSQLYTSKRT